MDLLRQTFREIDKAGTGLVSIPQFTITLNALDPKFFTAASVTKMLEARGVLVGGKVKYARFFEWLEGGEASGADCPCQRRTGNQSKEQAALFMEKWDAYKAMANAAVGKAAHDSLAKPVDNDGDGDLDTVGEKFLARFDVDHDGIIGPSEFDAMEGVIADEWKRKVDEELDKRACAKGTTRAALEKEFVEGQIAGIEAKGYVLTDAAKECLGQMLRRFHICDVGTAAFSVHSVEEMAKADMSIDELGVTVSQHCLQMAMHWLRNPPEFLSVPELEELVVLSIFHDVYYYDDFLHHGARVVEDLEPFLMHEVPRAVVGGHLHLSPDKRKLQNLQFDSPLEALKQEWVQMDWYLTMVNVKHEATRTMRVGDGVQAPLCFFHHHLGHFFTKGNHMVIAKANNQEKNW